jgi:hypothetical protein
MTLARVEGAPALARWTGRIVLFSLGLALFAAVAHRFFGLATPVLLALLKLAFAGAFFGLILAVFAAMRIWRHGGTGTARVVLATVVGLGMLAWPLSYYPTIQRLPMLYDVTTDFSAPPQFRTLVGARDGSEANGATYNSADFTKLQQSAYPDIKPMLVNRSVEETFDLVVDAVRRQKMRIVREIPPGDENGRSGSLEAVDRTMIMGFADDVAIRVTGDDANARVDLRSASRYGRHDLGRNVERIRNTMREIVTRLESTIPGAAENRRRRKGAERFSKARKDAGRKKADPRR